MSDSIKQVSAQLGSNQRPSPFRRRRISLWLKKGIAYFLQISPLRPVGIEPTTFSFPPEADQPLAEKGNCLFFTNLPSPPSWDRTNDLLLKRELLYQLSYGRRGGICYFKISSRNFLPTPDFKKFSLCLASLLLANSSL